MRAKSFYRAGTWSVLRNSKSVYFETRSINVSLFWAFLSTSNGFFKWSFWKNPKSKKKYENFKSFKVEECYWSQILTKPGLKIFFIFFNKSNSVEKLPKKNWGLKILWRSFSAAYSWQPTVRYQNYFGSWSYRFNQLVSLNLSMTVTYFVAYT